MNKGLFSLHLRVERQKIALARLADRYGREDPRVLAKSRAVDRLIVELQRRRMAG